MFTSSARPDSTTDPIQPSASYSWRRTTVLPKLVSVSRHGRGHTPWHTSNSLSNGIALQPGNTSPNSVYPGICGHGRGSGDGDGVLGAVVVFASGAAAGGALLEHAATTHTSRYFAF